ncbi:MAG: transcription antitermination factor NusB [Holosporaceae bacterium]|jgi:N utilization substance protein B|nr:transcription antitermination factor NusB [Holosporaceae bacterium]
MARLCAVQTLYSLDFRKSAFGEAEESGGYDEAVLSEEASASEMDRDFFRKLMSTTEANLPETDAIIAKNLSVDWRFERLDPVMRSLLRLGVTELTCFENSPPKVVFNEYIEIAKMFFEKSETAFVNGLLNSVAADVAGTSIVEIEVAEDDHGVI